MTPINEKTQAIIDSIPRVIRENKIDKKTIQESFDSLCENWNVPKREVLIYDRNLKGWEFVTAQTAKAGAAWDAAWDAAWGAARGAAWDAAWDAARGAARDAAWDAARGAALINSCECDKSDCKICSFRIKDEPLRRAFEAGAFTYWLTPTNIIVICSPRIYHANGRLHREDGPAIEWPSELYWFLHGVRLDEAMHKKIVGQKMSFAEIMRLENIEHRMVALKYMEPEKLLKGTGAKLIDKSTNRGNELWLVDSKSIFPNPELFLKYGCPSTERVYMKCVEREWALLPDGNLSADKAQATSHRFTLEEYMQLTVEG